MTPSDPELIATHEAATPRRKELVSNVCRWLLIVGYVIALWKVDSIYQPRAIGILSVIALLLMAFGILRFKKVASGQSSDQK